jgi:hypothetical protein
LESIAIYNPDNDAGGKRVNPAETQIVLRLDPGSDSDPEERAELAFRLRDELAGLDVDSIQLGGSADAPDGAKSGNAVEWGTLLVAVVSSGALTALVNAVGAWAARQRGGSVSVKIGADELVLSAASREDQRRLVEEWLERQGAAVQTDG